LAQLIVRRVRGASQGQEGRATQDQDRQQPDHLCPLGRSAGDEVIVRPRGRQGKEMASGYSLPVRRMPGKGGEFDDRAGMAFNRCAEAIARGGQAPPLPPSRSPVRRGVRPCDSRGRGTITPPKGGGGSRALGEREREVGECWTPEPRSRSCLP